MGGDQGDRLDIGHMIRKGDARFAKYLTKHWYMLQMPINIMNCVLDICGSIYRTYTTVLGDN